MSNSEFNPDKKNIPQESETEKQASHEKASDAIIKNQHMSLGEKIKSARKNAGMTQEQLASWLSVSRQAITKWEADKGIPDTENLKTLAKVLNVSIDYLLDDGTELSFTVLRTPIDLSQYNYKASLRSNRWVKKTGQKDMIIKEKFQDAEIHMLMAEQIKTKAETIIDNLLFFFTDAGGGTSELINCVKNMDKVFYLVNQDEKQFLVMITDEFLEARQLNVKITTKKFKIGNFKFRDCGILK